MRRLALRTVFAVFAVSVVAALAAACGGTAPQSPSGPPANATGAPSTVEREPTTIDEAKQQIQSARAILESRAEAQQGAEQPAAPLDSSSSACGDACRAIASMRRAVEALCRLSGESDDQCTDARATLSRCEARVASCGC
jgi:hypothetical protein